MNEELKTKAAAFFLALGNKDISDRDVAWQGVTLLLDKFTQDGDGAVLQTAYARLKRINPA